MRINKHPLKLKHINYKRLFKFSVVGLTSTFIDFAVLNLLSVLTGINRGAYAAVFSVISFLVANVNSYHMNKNWTFRWNSKNAKYRKYLKLSIVGVAANLAFVYFFTEFVRQDQFSSIVWLNISKLTATVQAAFINYYNFNNQVFTNPQVNEQTV